MKLKDMLSKVFMCKTEISINTSLDRPALFTGTVQEFKQNEQYSQFMSRTLNSVGVEDNRLIIYIKQSNPA